MKKSLPFLIISILLLISCTRREFNNPAAPGVVTENLKAPTNLTIRVADENILELNWEDNSEVEECYQIYRKLGSETTYNLHKTVEANTTQWQDEFVELYNTYAYRIYAANDEYRSAEAAESAFVYSLYAPSDFTIEALEENKIKLSWEDNNHFEEGYRIERKAGDSDWEAFATVPPDSTSWEYTMDGSNDQPLTWRAKTFYKSLQSPATVEVSLKVESPVLSNTSDIYHNEFSLSMDCVTSGAQIRYTIDGSTPTLNSNLYSKPILITSPTTLKTKAFRKGWFESEGIEASYSFKVAPLSFDPASGAYAAPQSVSINCLTLGTEVRYTTDGSTPTSSSTLYNEPIQVGSNTTIKARAFKRDWDASEIYNAFYFINLPIVATPTFSPSGGTYYESQSVTLSCATSGATIRYTTDGSTPTDSSIRYIEPISINEITTLNVKAFRNFYEDSAVATATYNMKVFAPTFNLTEGTYYESQSIAINCATSGATIRYTTDGSTPTSSSTLYDSPISIGRTTTLKAGAFKSGYLDSGISTASYEMKVTTPTFSPTGDTYSEPQNITISSATNEATIRYTTDGTPPNSSSTLYSDAIQISTNTTLRAKAFRSGWTDSEIASSFYHIIPERMVYVPGGTFIMGDTRGEGSSDELPTHSVTLSPFYIGKYEVTQGEYQAIMGSNPADGYVNSPVFNVSWYDVIKYCNLRSMAEGLIPVYSINGSTNPHAWGTVPNESNSTWDAVICNWYANGYRLPTEAEWEYAASGATNNPDYLYSGSDNIDDVAWYNGNTSNTQTVGGKAANSLGTYDMSGNVFEMCWDWYDSFYYGNSPSNNPTGPVSGSGRIRRGGYYGSDAFACRVSFRSNFIYANRSNINGFRVCRSIN